MDDRRRHASEIAHSTWGTLGAALAVGAVAALAAAALAPPAQAQDDLVDSGRELFGEGCASCHGPEARGIPGRGPSLRGAGAAAADFYLRTGRMPLPSPGVQPRRAEPVYGEEEIEALVAYVGSFGGPEIPDVDPARGSLVEGRRLFEELCAGCHQIVGRGGIMPDAFVPELLAAEPVDVGEAVEIGPHVMPHFPGLDQEEVDSLARYIERARHPEDRGGWGIGHIGPIPEGMVAWLLAGVLLLVAIRLIGERTTR